MIDAVRVCGRWVSKSVLESITARTHSAEPPTRKELITRFCRRTQWYNRKGELCYSSAAVGLKRLERQGLVHLPATAYQKPRLTRRQLFDDGQPLPPLPQLPASVEGLVELQVRLVADESERRLWNRLISRLHPLKGAPLVASQLHYLIWAGPVVLGAFGFGPPAFFLSCRDSWIGWDRQAQDQNRHLLIGLSRFLIRPEVRIANLASRAYSLVLRRVAQDWFERYGVKPVLVETYVDRSTYTGRSLAAANALRLGQSQGRGRTSRSQAHRPKSIKDVWVWPLVPRARARLQQRTLPPVVARSVFACGDQNDWVREELDGLELGHAKLHRRFERMLSDRFCHPDRSFYTSFGDRAGGKAAYALMESGRANLRFENLLAPHQNNTRRRMAAEKVVLMIEDTTTLSYNTLHQTQGLGPVGDRRHPGRGLLLHTLMGFRLDGIPLGCAWAKVWAREKVSDTAQRNTQSIDQKESARWLEGFQTANLIAAQMPQTHMIVIGDREADIMDLYDRATVSAPNVSFLVRAQHDRVLQNGQGLWEQVSNLPCGGTMRVKVPRRGNRPTREAGLELRWAKVQVKPPRVGCKNSWGNLEVWALLAREVQPPPGAQPIEWLLLTNRPIPSLKAARRLIRWYGVRWGIECWHQVLKDTCRVESRQLKSAQALSRALTLDMIVAWRILLLCRLGKTHPTLPAAVLYSPEELAVIESLKKTPRN